MGIWVDKRVKQREWGIFEPNRCSIAHGFGGGPKVRACCGPKIDLGMPGTVVGPMVYANYGRVEDYATLREMGVNVSNTVVLARYGKIFRGDIVHNAYSEGWPSIGECERLSDEEVENEGNVPLIPPLPISWADGDAIIRTIGGNVVNVDWKGGEDSPIYRVGPGPAIANLSYEVYDELKRRDMVSEDSFSRVADSKLRGIKA
ncbi:hypothetical protein CQW23_06675 [Capsicum baccatum]|uniref:Uncharacterized protein n=1 Tax=Capsicum baccatum TaxID=33114 RepID=A0A2G2X429_CAPBA|nr:hypothetical protein CQW23_06675 [Capsicum baccatum]